MKAKRFIPIVLSLLMAGSLFVGCGGNDKKPDPEKPGPSQSEDPTVSEVVATANKTEAKVGETVTLSAEVRGTNNPSQAVTWQITAGSDIATLNGAVLTLTGAGTVKVVAKSTADTTKTSNELTITVSASAVPETPTVTEVVASADKTEAKVGETVTLSAVVNGTNNPSQDVTWEITEGSGLATLGAAVLTLTGAGTIKVVATSTADTTKKSNEITITVTANDQGDTQQSTPLPAANKIYVVGDSTVCSFSDDYYLPRYGYGTQLAQYLNVSTDQIVNLAMSGRSSKSFLTEGNYQTLLSSISAGDYLIIGFGHNDEKSAEPARFTDPAGTKDVETTAKGTSFKWSLYQNYIKVATDKGATPILCTPIVRYASDGNYSGAKAHITEDGNYSQAIVDLGAETGTTVIDLTALTKAVYTADNANAAYYHAHSSYAGEIKTPPYDGTETPEGRDDTHINMYGAKMVAYQFANALKETESSLKAHIKSDIVAPTKEADYLGAIKQDYVKAAYSSFDPAANAAANLTGEWYKACMGELGGASTDPFTITSSAADAFAITCTGTKGKIQGSSDGFASVFRQIPINKNFTASATVTVKTVGDVKQAGFGMMLRDDIYMNVTAKDGLTLNSNYVAAGALTNQGAASTAIFSRESTALKKSSNTVTLTAGQQINVSIVRVGQTVTVNFGDSTQTFTDFDFRSVDTDYMYLCLFATRGFAVEFTNVQFEITGDSQGA